MRIIVPVKQVPETNAVRMDEQTGTMVREGVEAIVNPLDLYAIETALRLRDARGGRVTAVSMGPAAADKAVREAISMGCDDGVLLTDQAFAGSDTWATSYTLAAAIRKLGRFDLVCCGERATDGDTGQVGPGIAAFLELPAVTYVGAVDAVDDGHIRVRRLVETGHEVLDADMPCVLTVVKEVGAPRLPTLRGKQRARAADVPRWGAGDLDVEPDKLGLSGSPTRVVNIFRPTVARTCEMLTAGDDPAAEAAADRFVAFLRQKQLLVHE
ncbi:MAG: electron transfer flavoprotein subunit beta/FixA family protein [Planctomycetota bacterium]